MRESIHGCVERVRCIQIRARLNIFRGALRQVDQPASFFVRELLFYPLRPIVSGIARRNAIDPGAAWTKLLRGSRNAYTYRLRASGHKIVIRHATSDVFLIWEIFDQRAYAIPPEPHRILESIGRPIRLVDLGANIGLGARFLDGELPIASVIAYEPISADLPILRRNLAQTASQGPWRINEAAAYTHDSSVGFVIGRPLEGRISLDGADDGARVPARDVFRDLQNADLLKMDIEGGEWAILQDQRLAQTSLRAIVMEFHSWGCPDEDPEACARSLLERAGFTVQAGATTGADFGVLWGWRA
jgi:FkbM family methyltransferase